MNLNEMVHIENIKQVRFHPLTIQASKRKSTPPWGFLYRLNLRKNGGAYVDWVTQNLQNALNTWNEKLTEIWKLLTQSPKNFKGGGIWDERLENACERILIFTKDPSIRNISTILKNGQDKVDSTIPKSPPAQSSARGITRGPSYFSKGGDKQ